MKVFVAALLRRSVSHAFLLAMMTIALPAICITAPAVMTTPVPGTKLTSTTVTFGWTSGTSIVSYSLYLGSTLGARDIYGATQGTSRSGTISNLPKDGRTLYVRLFSKSTTGAWYSRDYTYSAAGTATTASCDSIALGKNASLNGFQPFATSSSWHRDVSAATIDSNSTAIVNYIGATRGLHADFGAGTYNGQYIGIPYVVVNGSQKSVPINISYADEGDPGPMPIPANAPIEGDPNPSSGDRHVVVIDNARCWIYELYSAYPAANGAWNAAGAAIWDLLGDEKRPYTWTSVDAAGLPLFAGLIRYDEVARGEINHAIRFTLQRSRQAFVPPASHWAPNSTDSLAAPMGMRVRLRASFDISKYSAANQVILKAMKKYGMIMADNGSSMFISGVPDDRWNNSDLSLLGNVKASDFEVIAMNPVYTYTSVPTGPPPSINSFSASSTTVAAGTPVTLSWSVSGASYLIVTPVGPVRGSSLNVTPSSTTTYTLVATNQYGRTTRTVSVNVK